MENWMVMGGAILLVCLLCPAVLGFAIGAGGVMLLTVLIYAVLGRLF
jgi:hypothetical protein